jgi:hypothetical protein
VTPSRVSSVSATWRSGDLVAAHDDQHAEPEQDAGDEPEPAEHDRPDRARQPRGIIAPPLIHPGGGGGDTGLADTENMRPSV